MLELDLSMGFDPFHIENVRNETREELSNWKTHFRPGSPQHIAATVELSRRDELTSFRRFWVGFAMVALSLILVTVFLIRQWWQ